MIMNREVYMSKGLIPHEPAYSGHANNPIRKADKKGSKKKPIGKRYKQRTEEMRHTQTSRGH
jgi:hypothetical protein